MDWARAARSEKERAIFVEMAQTRLSAAARLEPGVAELIANVGSSSTPTRGPPVNTERNPNLDRTTVVLTNKASVFPFGRAVGFSGSFQPRPLARPTLGEKQTQRQHDRDFASRKRQRYSERNNPVVKDLAEYG